MVRIGGICSLVTVVSGPKGHFGVTAGADNSIVAIPADKHARTVQDVITISTDQRTAVHRTGIDRVVASTAVHRVVAAVAVKCVVARAAFQRVVAGIAGDIVALVVGGQVEAVCHARHKGVERLDIVGQFQVRGRVDGVEAFVDVFGDDVVAAIDIIGVVARAAGQRIVAGSVPLKRVVAGPSIQVRPTPSLVGLPGQGPFSIGADIVVAIIAVQKADPDDRVVVFAPHQIVAVALIIMKVVVAFTTNEEVVAFMAIKTVIACTAVEKIAMRIADKAVVAVPAFNAVLRGTRHRIIIVATA